MLLSGSATCSRTARTAKNNPFEMEPSGVGRLDNLIVHDLIINNVLGQTHLLTAESPATALY